MTMPAIYKQLRRVEFTIHFAHMQEDPKDNDGFRAWWDEWVVKQFGQKVRWIGASLERIPESDKDGIPNKNAGLFHVNGFACFSKPVRMITQKRRRPGQGMKQLGLVPQLHWISVREVENADGLYDYVTGGGKYAGKEGVIDRMQYGEYPRAAGIRRERLAESAIRMLVEDGMRPTQIAAANPKAFFVHHRSIHALYDALKMHEMSGEPARARDRNAPEVTGFSVNSVNTITPSPSELSQIDDWSSKKSDNLTEVSQDSDSENEGQDD